MGAFDLPRRMNNPDLPKVFSVRLDWERRATLEREAFRLRVSLSEAARALLYLAAFPPEGFRESLYPREIIRFHEGTINVMSQAGRPGGTLVRVMFPGIVPEPGTPQPKKPEAPAAPLKTP